MAPSTGLAPSQRLTGAVADHGFRHVVYLKRGPSVRRQCISRPQRRGCVRRAGLLRLTVPNFRRSSAELLPSGRRTSPPRALRGDPGNGGSCGATTFGSGVLRVVLLSSVICCLLRRGQFRVCWEGARARNAARREGRSGSVRMGLAPLRAAIDRQCASLGLRVSHTGALAKAVQEEHRDMGAGLVVVDVGAAGVAGTFAQEAIAGAARRIHA